MTIHIHILYFSFSTGFLTILIQAGCLSIITFFIKKCRGSFVIAETHLDWRVSFIGILFFLCIRKQQQQYFDIVAMILSTVTAFLWIWRNPKLREFIRINLQKIVKTCRSSPVVEFSPT